MAYNEHMRLAIPERHTGVEELVRSPQSIAHPVGWKSLLEFGPYEATIATKCLSRCPHCQTHGGSSPVWNRRGYSRTATLLTDPELRVFSIEKPWNDISSKEAGPSAHAASVREEATPPLDTPPSISNNQTKLLDNYASAIHPQDSGFIIEQWSIVVEVGGGCLSAGCGMSVYVRSRIIGLLGEGSRTHHSKAGCFVFLSWKGGPIPHLFCNGRRHLWS